MRIVPVITCTLADGSEAVWPVLDRPYSPPDVHDGIARGVFDARARGATQIAVSLMDTGSGAVFEPRSAVV